MVLQWLTRRKSTDEPEPVLESPEEKSGKDYSKMDVGQICDLINSNNLPKEEYRKILEATIQLGHLGLLERVLEVGFGRKPYDVEFKKCLAHAVPLRGVTIWDENTSVGGCYQRLHGQDYRKLEIDLTEKSTGEKIPFNFGEDVLDDPFWVASRTNFEQLRDHFSCIALVTRGYMTPQEASKFMNSRYSAREED